VNESLLSDSHFKRAGEPPTDVREGTDLPVRCKARLAICPPCGAVGGSEGIVAIHQ
jgi:hypothetical protein